MKSAFWRSIAVVALVAVPMMANANDATIGSEVANSAMYGGTLMNTTAIFNVFPHLVTGNGTGVELNTMNSGAGKIWWEAYDELWLTMDVGLMNYGMSGSAFMWGNGWNFVNPYAGSAIFSNFNMVNLGIAKPLSGGGAWAVGVKLAPFGGVESTDAADVTDEINATGYGFNGSWGNGDGLHVGGEFAMTKFETVDGTADETDEQSTMGFGVTGRYDTDLYIYQANFAYTTDGLSGDNFAEDDDTTALGFMVNAGRYLKNEVDGQATAEFGIGWASFGNEVGDVTDDSSAFLLPAVRVSAWEKIGDYFGLMGGLGFTHAFLGNEFDDGTDTTEDKLAGSTFDWSAGLFFQPTDNVRLDARFESGNLNQVLSLGNDSPLVMYLGATVGLN
jgi:hypothetical protein